MTEPTKAEWRRILKDFGARKEGIDSVLSEHSSFKDWWVNGETYFVWVSGGFMASIFIIALALSIAAGYALRALIDTNPKLRSDITAEFAGPLAEGKGRGGGRGAGKGRPVK